MRVIELNYIGADELGLIECRDEKNETFVAYKIPRSQIRSRGELPLTINNSGIYMLFGANETGKKKAYIGQVQIRQDGKSFIERLIEHDGKRDFWTEAIVFTKRTVERDDNFGSDQLDYIEASILQEFANINAQKDEDDQYDIDNVQFPNPDHVVINDRRKTPCIMFLDSVKYVTYFLGHDMFSKKHVEEIQEEQRDDKKYCGKLNIDEIKELCVSCGYIYNGEWRRATGSKSKSVYYSNPDIELLDKGWTFVLNDIDNEIIYVLQIPPKKFKVSDFIIRQDKNNYINLHIKYGDPDFTDTKSGIKFKDCCFGQVDYSGPNPISTLKNINNSPEKTQKKKKENIDKPTGFTIRGKTFEVSSWSDIDRKLIELLTSIDEVKMYQLATSNYCLPNGKSIHIATEKEKIKASRNISGQVCSLGTIYFMTGMSNVEHMKMYKDLLSKFGIPFDELKIY